MFVGLIILNLNFFKRDILGSKVLDIYFDIYQTKLLMLMELFFVKLSKIEKQIFKVFLKIFDSGWYRYL